MQGMAGGKASAAGPMTASEEAALRVSEGHGMAGGNASAAGPMTALILGKVVSSL